MRRLCRLKSYKGIGEDGKWAASEIETLRAQLAECQRELEAVKTKALMDYAVAAGDCIIAREQGYKEGFTDGMVEQSNKQQEEISTLREQLATTSQQLDIAVELYEQALKASWPDGAMGDAFDYWNSARAAIRALKREVLK